MGYDEAVSYLDSLGIDAMKSVKPSLHRMEALCEAMDHPERRFPSLHITGTNGKTSTARIATSLLEEIGLSVGTYTSPHLQTVRERISHSGHPLDEAAFGDAFDHFWPYLQEVEARLGEKATYFEVLTAMFFLWAADAPVDVAVVEVGLGGRWDATNVVHAPIAAITNVALDHTQLLGEDRLTIAREKAGIIKKGAMVITAERAPDVLAVITEAVEGVGGTLVAIDKDFVVTENKLAVDGRFLSVKTRARDYDGVFVPLHGAHQGRNTAVALELVTSFLPEESLDDEVVSQGLAHTDVPGRLERIHNVILDVAHNPTGMSALVGSLEEEFAPDEAVFVMGALSGHDYRGMVTELSRIPCRIFVCRPKNVRATDPKTIALAAEEFGINATVEEDVVDAIAAATSLGETLVCVTGSHYVVGEARDYLLRSTVADQEV